MFDVLNLMQVLVATGRRPYTENLGLKVIVCSNCLDLIGKHAGNELSDGWLAREG